MSEEVVLQRLPEKNFCADIFDGICSLKSAVEQFINNREFTREHLADMLPCGEEIRVVNAETSIPDNYATPSIAMSRSDINYGAPVIRDLGGHQIPAHAMCTVTFEIKTNNYRTTEYMALELSQFLHTFIPYFRTFNLNVSNIVCGATKQFRDSTPNYFFSKVSITAGVPLVIWKYQGVESILRSVTYNLNIRGGDTEPVALT